MNAGTGVQILPQSVALTLKVFPTAMALHFASESKKCTLARVSF